MFRGCIPPPPPPPGRRLQTLQTALELRLEVVLESLHGQPHHLVLLHGALPQVVDVADAHGRELNFTVNHLKVEELLVEQTVDGLIACVEVGAGGGRGGVGGS